VDADIAASKGNAAAITFPALRSIREVGTTRSEPTIGRIQTSQGIMVFIIRFSSDHA
jgi:hypothetical protein